MRYIIATILAAVIMHNAAAQETGNIQGMVIAAAKNNYTILLKRAADSGLVKVELTDNSNNYVLEHIAYGSYFIEVSFLNNVLARTSAFELNTRNFVCSDIRVDEKTNDLKEVQVVSQKNIVERKADKIVYNVENSLEPPSNDALAVMQKAPGLTVDADGNISMRGKKGVMVMLNGKMTYLSGPQLANLLRTTTANQISKIEVISNPSSKYDAEGNAGIVNIVLKKDQRQGTNGMVVLSYGMGKYHKAVGGVNMNWKKNKVNVFASYNYFNDKGYNDLSLYRQFYTNHVYEGAYRQHNYLLFPNYGNLGKLGVDYNVSKKTIIGFVGNVTANKFDPDGDNKAYVEDPNGITASSYTSQSRSREHWYNFGLNGNLKHTFDSAGTELSVDADYAQYGNTANQYFTTRYFDLLDNEYRLPHVVDGSVNSMLYIHAIKADFVHPLKNGQKLEFGGKSSLVRADNNLAYANDSAGIATFDSAQSNHFIYSENINALYANWSGEWKKNSLQVGLRAEQTIADGHQLINDNKFNRNYWQLFPTLFITHNFNTDNDMGLSLSRRIQRPSYDQMNPVRLFIDATTYKEGNPYLVPQNSYLAELSHTYKQKYLTTFSASIINKSITEVLIPDPDHNNITIQTNKNINQQYLYSLNVSVPFKITRWWNTTNEATAYYSKYVGQLADLDINSAVVSYNAKTIQTFTLPKSYTLQLDAFIQGAERYSFTTLEAFGAVNVSAQKLFKDRRSTLKLSATDVFFNSQFTGSSLYSNYAEHFHVSRNSRVVSLSFSYRYGNGNVPRIRQRTTGADDEKQRAGKKA